MLAALFVALVAPAAAQSFPPQAYCDDREAAERLLTGKYSEVIVWRGINGSGLMVELWAAEGGTWTMTLMGPDGKKTCLITAGDGWQLPSYEFPVPGVDQ